MKQLLIPVLLALTLSCKQQTGTLLSSSLSVQRLDDNCLPVEVQSSESVSGGVSYRYVVRSEECLCHFCPMLVCNGQDIRTVTVNGEVLEPVTGLHLSDMKDACFTISDHVVEGDNTVEVRSGGEVPTVYVAGDFSVFQSEVGKWYVTPEHSLSLGNLVPQGLPFYSGEISYSRQYEIPEISGRCILIIPHWEGSDCEVFVNGDKAADVSTKHFKMNIDPFLNAGFNYVEIRIAGHKIEIAGKCNPQDFGLIEDFKMKLK